MWSPNSSWVLFEALSELVEVVMNLSVAIGIMLILIALLLKWAFKWRS